MFGYVKTDLPNMYIKDTVLYRSMYCGLCKGIGNCCNNKARLALNYDLTFLSVLMHNLANVDVEIVKERCIVHWLKKRPIAKVDELTRRIACLNVILAYHKCNDDVIDSGKGRMKRSFFKSAYKKAVKQEPVLDKIVTERYAELIEYEKTNGDSIDMSADPFGKMMREITSELLKDKKTEKTDALSYNLGKWIYLIDALDDFDKDKKKRSFNVFVNIYSDINSKQELIDKKRNELEFVFGTILSDVIADAHELGYNFNHDLTDNILFKGLMCQTKNIMENKKCKNISKF